MRLNFSPHMSTQEWLRPLRCQKNTFCFLRWRMSQDTTQYFWWEVVFHPTGLYLAFNCPLTGLRLQVVEFAPLCYLVQTSGSHLNNRKIYFFFFKKMIFSFFANYIYTIIEKARDEQSHYVRFFSVDSIGFSTLICPEGNLRANSPFFIIFRSLHCIVF